MNIKVVTLTIPKNKLYSNNVNFNPSIIHIHDNVFLLSFHVKYYKNIMSKYIKSNNQLINVYPMLF